MKRTAIAIGIALVVILADGIVTADALPIDWFRKRNGLTDAQVDDIFERNPNAILRLSRGKWMELKYRLHRFDNMKDWLNMQIQGKLGDEILRVTDTNKVLVASNSTLCVEAAYQRDRADAAEDYARITREIRKASKRCEKNLKKIVKTLEQAKKKAETDEEAALYSALIAVIQDIAPNVDVMPFEP